MTAALGLGEAPLTVLLDLRNPQSFLALAPTMALGVELDIEIDWLPLRVPPLRAPTLPSREDDRSVLHRRHRARAIAREIETYGQAHGLTLRELYRDDDPRSFELGWLWVRERSARDVPAYLEVTMRRWWAVDLDPADPAAVRPCIEACGVEADGFDAWCGGDGATLAEHVRASLAGQGFSAVPGYWVDGEYFQGRQHLPMIRWILEEREGPGPI